MKAITKLTAALLALSLLAGCASMRGPNASWQPPKLTAPATASLADATVTYLEGVWPPAATTVYVYPQTKKDLDNIEPTNFYHALHGALLHAGYGVVADASDGQALRYRITKMGDGLLLRLNYGQAEAARYYRKASTGQWVAVTPFTVRQNHE